MAFSLPQLIGCRPFLYHLTAASNLSSIIRTREFRCANVLLAESGLTSHSSQRRIAHLAVPASNGSTLLRDQKPLIEGAIEFEDGWDMARFVQHVNQHVFFWPGGHQGPIKSGMNRFERYRAERPVLLRFPIACLKQVDLRFSRFNSGAPRCSGGKYSPRGSNTYLPAVDFVGTASEVVEVVVAEACALPATAELSNHPSGPWKLLQVIANSRETPRLN